MNKKYNPKKTKEEGVIVNNNDIPHKDQYCAKIERNLKYYRIAKLIITLCIVMYLIIKFMVEGI